MTQRTERIDELFRQEISALLVRDIGDPRIGFTTVTDVETTPDLRHARIWVSVIGQPEDRAAAVKALERAMPFVRHELGKRLRLKRIPEFTVRLDESSERGTRVLHLIDELEAGGMPDDMPEGESLPTPTVGVPREPDALVIPGLPAEFPGAANGRPRSGGGKSGAGRPRKGPGAGTGTARGTGRGSGDGPKRGGKGRSPRAAGRDA